MPAQGGPPIGLDVTRTGRLLQRAFDDELVAVGGSLPAWLILTTVKQAGQPIQRDIAAAVGLEDATLTHHLRRMEQDGLVTRHRPPDNRRNQVVAITPEGERLFQRMLETVIAFDARLRHGFSERELTLLPKLLARLRTNVRDPGGVPARGRPEVRPVRSRPS